MKTEKKIVDLSKEERIRIKGLNKFIENADHESRVIFRDVCNRMNHPAHKWAEDIYAAGFLSVLNVITLKINHSTKQDGYEPH